MDQLQVMNFLNEVASKFPNAISLASGRPHPSFFDQQKWPQYQDLFADYFAKEQGVDATTAQQLLCQYGPSAGIINSVLQQHLAVDESIDTTASNIIVTNGCQEALTLLCLHELQRENECMLTIDPAYIGFSGLLAAIGKRVEAVDIRQIHRSNPDGEDTFDWQYLRDRVADIRQAGIVPKAIYINPDFNNPLSYRLTKAARLSLLALCHELQIKVIEDNPYSRFDYTDESVLSLKSLDSHDNVYHIGSFAKTFCPGVRIGYLVVPQSWPQDYKSLVALKSLVSVNTSSLTQAVVGGFLIDNDFSLSGSMTRMNQQYQQQRDAVTEALDTHFGDFDGVSWNVPQGGFFAVIELPFDFNEDDVYACARENNVICMPVGFFSLAPETWQGSVRIAFSNFDGDVLAEGVKRLGQFVAKRLG